MAALTLALAVSGCATRAAERTPRTAPPTPVAHYEMDPVQIVAERQPDGRLVVVHRDAASLFEQAGRLYAEGEHAAAAEHYSLLLQEFPDSDYVIAAHYNLGLALEELGRPADAVPHYRAIVQADPGSNDALDSRFRLCECFQAMEDYDSAVAVMQEVTGLPGLGREDRLLAKLELADSLLGAQQLDEADRLYRTLLDKPRLKGEPQPLDTPVPMVARAQLGIGRVEHARFKRKQIRLPQERMERDINEKARMFLRAQSAYLRTIRMKVGDLVTAAGLGIGALYEDFYRDLMRAPIPPDLNAEEVEVYFEELRKVIVPLVEQAIHVYERNLLYAERMGVQSAWVDRSSARLEQLRSFLQGKAVPEPGFTTPPEADPASPSFIGPPVPPDLRSSAGDPPAGAGRQQAGPEAGVGSD